MTSLRVSIVRFVDSDQPGWVECELVDAHGLRHKFQEKVPIVSTDELHAGSQYPCEGLIACRVVSPSGNSKRDSTLIVDTCEPDGVESIDGVSRFMIQPSQL